MALRPEDLRARREIAKLAGVRVARRKIPRQKEPSRLRYQKYLTQIRKTLEQLLREEIFPELEGWLRQANQERGGLRRDALVDDVIRTFSNLRLQFASIHPETQIEQEVAQVSEEINRKQKVEHQKQVKAGLGIEVIQPEPFLQPVLDTFVADNQALVTSLVEEQLSAFQTITSRGIRAGLRVESIRQEIMAKLGVTKSRASLLARDQTLKLAGELTELRQRSVGVEEYIWDTSQDERVRKRHAELHGTRQKWDKPPIVDQKSGRRAHPGGDYQCRCQGIPVFPEPLTQEQPEELTPKKLKPKPRQKGSLVFGTKEQSYEAVLDSVGGDIPNNFVSQEMAYKAYKAGKGPKPPPYMGGELDAINEALDLHAPTRREISLGRGVDRRVSSPREGWDRLTKGIKRWDDPQVEEALEVMRQVPGFEKLQLPEDVIETISKRRFSEQYEEFEEFLQEKARKKLDDVPF